MTAQDAVYYIFDDLLKLSIKNMLIISCSDNKIPKKVLSVNA